MKDLYYSPLQMWQRRMLASCIYNQVWYNHLCKPKWSHQRIVSIPYGCVRNNRNPCVVIASRVGPGPLGPSLPMLPGVRPLISFLHDAAIGLATGGRGWRHCCPIHDVYVVTVLLYFLKYLKMIKSIIFSDWLTKKIFKKNASRVGSTQRMYSLNAP